MNVKVQVRYFALLRETTGSEGEKYSFPQGTTILELRTQLGSHRPEVMEILSEARFAVNEDFVDDSYVLADGDFVAVIPPVSGG